MTWLQETRPRMRKSRVWGCVTLAIVLPVFIYLGLAALFTSADPDVSRQPKLNPRLESIRSDVRLPRGAAIGLCKSAETPGFRKRGSLPAADAWSRHPTWYSGPRSFFRHCTQTTEAISTC